MDSHRLNEITEHIDRVRAGGGALGRYLCGMCVEVTGVTGAGIMLMSDGQHRGMVGASNGTAQIAEELQFTTGEGPCIDAFRGGQPVLEPDLAGATPGRWPAFTGPAVDAGIRSIFGIPLGSGSGVCVGALDLYYDHPGLLSTVQLDDAVVLAGVVADTVITMQAEAAHGTLATGLEPALRFQAVVHQASGMLSARLGIGVEDALARLRAHAYAENRSIHGIARAIVDRDFDFDSTDLA